VISTKHLETRVIEFLQCRSFSTSLSPYIYIYIYIYIYMSISVVWGRGGCSIFSRLIPRLRTNPASRVVVVVSIQHTVETIETMHKSTNRRRRRAPLLNFISTSLPSYMTRSGILTITWRPVNFRSPKRFDATQLHVNSSHYHLVVSRSRRD